MASITIDATKIRIVTFDEVGMLNAIASAALVGGKHGKQNTSTGKLEEAQGDSAGTAGTARWLVPRTVAAGEAFTAYRGALVDLGPSALDGLNFGVPLYLADDGGITATIGESTTATVVGYVVPGRASGSTPDRLMQQVW
jgi:hypothetical protein